MAALLAEPARPGANGDVVLRLRGADLHEASTGERVGRFESTSFPVGGGDEQPARTLQFHRFELDDGTIVGTGTTGPDSQGGTFAIVGGTGRYLGVRGSYTALACSFVLPLRR